MEALEKQNFPCIYIAVVSQTATWQNSLLLQNATSEKCGFERILEKHWASELSWIDPKLPTVIFTVLLQSLCIAWISFNVQVIQKQRNKWTNPGIFPADKDALTTTWH